MNAIRTSVLILAAATFPAASMAQTAFAERSEVLATGKDVHLYSLTTRDDQGGNHCYDVLVSLPIGSDGLPGSSAPVTAKGCPKVKPGEFVVGDYSDVTNGWACALQASPHMGRTQLDLSCDTGGYHWMYTWFTGPIKGSPIEDLLVNAGLDKLPDHDDYSWGRVVMQNWNYDGCTYVNSLFGAREVGGRITLSIYKGDALLDCTHTYQKAP